MDFNQFTFRQIEENLEIKSFDCGDADLNDFLINDAKDYLKAMMALTYLLEDKSANKTVAFYSLLNDKIVFDPEEKRFWNRLNRRIEILNDAKNIQSLKSAVLLSLKSIPAIISERQYFCKYNICSLLCVAASADS